MNFSVTCWRDWTRAASLVAVTFGVQTATAREPLAAPLKMPQQFSVSAADPLAARPYLDDTNSVAARDGEVEVVKERYPNGAVRIERCVILDPDKNYVNHGSWKMYSATGSVIAEGQYDMGRRIGLWTRYIGRNESPVFNEQPYKNFKAPFISMANFENGLIDGEWLIEDVDKKKVVQISFKDGERHGPAIASTKSATGHLLGAAGGLEAIFTVLALRDQAIPPTLNLENPDEDAAGLDLVALASRQANFDYALSNGFGFGGVNASVIFKRWAG